MTLALYDPVIAEVPIAELVIRAGSGDEGAWRSLVNTLAPLLWVVAKSFRLDDALAKDVCQTVWLKLIESVGDIRRPERIEAWLVTTCKREAMRVKGARDESSSLEGWDVPATDPPPEDALIGAEDRMLVARSFDLLDDKCRELLSLFLAHPPLRYSEIAESMGMAVGSIGPVRRRCLDRLRVGMGATT